MPRWPSRTTDERFWNKVRRDSGCWEWIAARSRKGYGWFRGPVGAEFAHRVSWKLANGPIPDGVHVLHHCDNPPCVRPDHLFLGTHTDNVRDRDAKGRQRTPGGADHWSHRRPDLVPRGERYWAARAKAGI